MEDLEANTLHTQRSWWIEGVLSEDLGIHTAEDILRGAIFEAFAAHPELLARRARSVAEGFASGIAGQWGIGPFYVSSFWHQLPELGSAYVHPALRPRSFAMWVGAMDALTGTDSEARKISGRMPESWPEAREALMTHGNRIAMGNYLTTTSMNLSRPVLLLAVIGILFVFWSSQPALALALISASLVPSFASVFMSEVDTRHILMAYPIQLVTAGFVIEAMLCLARSAWRYFARRTVYA